MWPKLKITFELPRRNFYIKITLINFQPPSGSSRLLIEFAVFDFIYCVCNINDMLFTVVRTTKSAAWIRVLRSSECVQSYTICMIVFWTISNGKWSKNESENVQHCSFRWIYVHEMLAWCLLHRMHIIFGLNHKSKCSNNWQYHVCRTLLGCNRKNQIIWAIRCCALNELSLWLNVYQ